MKIDWVFLFYIGEYRWMLISSIHVEVRWERGFESHLADSQTCVSSLRVKLCTQQVNSHKSLSYKQMSHSWSIAPDFQSGQIKSHRGFESHYLLKMPEDSLLVPGSGSRGSMYQGWRGFLAEILWWIRFSSAPQKFMGVHVQGWRNGFAYRLGDFDYPHLHKFILDHYNNLIIFVYD